MAVISITITESSEQIVSGIPKTVSITTNIVSTVFYTLDGSAPTILSTIYVSPIFLPYAQFAVTLKVLATNGIDSSPVVTEVYQTDMVDSGARLPHSSTTQPVGGLSPDNFPFGSPPCAPRGEFVNPADSGVTVFNPALPATPTGFDANGQPTGFTNQPFNSENYQIPYSTTNAEGQTGRGIGTLPAQTSYNPNQDDAYDGEQTHQFTTTFDPRAFVIFQDFSKQDPNDPPQINRASFSLEDPERTRDGAYFMNSGPDGAPPPSGSFIRSFYNPRTNEVSHY
jgi:hypothetical protein